LGEAHRAGNMCPHVQQADQPGPTNRGASDTASNAKTALKRPLDIRLVAVSAPEKLKCPTIDPFKEWRVARG
jgi:hypothetical protein